MKEAAIIKSPYAFEPLKVLTKEDEEKRYLRRIDETFQAYTVIDVLRKVYRRSFSEDLMAYLGEHPGEFRIYEDGWLLSRAWINDLQVIRSESIFFQEVEDFRVDILVEARIKMEECRKNDGCCSRKVCVKQQYRLRYTFDFAPCKMECRFVKVITKEDESLQKEKSNLPVDKYLIPVMTGRNYEELAYLLQRSYYPISYLHDAPVDPFWWIRQMNRTVRMGVFPGNG